MRESWTDDRLDDLREDMNRGFANAREETAQLREDMNRGFANAREETAQLREDMNRGFSQLREEMAREFVRVDADIRELRVEVKSLRSEMNEIRSEVSARFDSLHRTLMAIGGGVLASVAATVLGAVFG